MRNLPAIRATLGVLLLAASPARATPPGSAAPASSATPYKFGVPPWQKDQSLDDIRGRYSPMLDWLRGLGEPRFGESTWHQALNP